MPQEPLPLNTSHSWFSLKSFAAGALLVLVGSVVVCDAWRSGREPVSANSTNVPQEVPEPLYLIDFLCNDTLCRAKVAGGYELTVPGSFNHYYIVDTRSNVIHFSDDTYHRISFSIVDMAYNSSDEMSTISGAIDPKVQVVGDRTFSSVVTGEIQSFQEHFHTGVGDKTAVITFRTDGKDEPNVVVTNLYEDQELVHAVLKSFKVIQ